MKIAGVAERIYTTLLKNQMASDRLAPMVVDKLEKSGSFEQAKRNMGLVTHIQHWTPSLLDRLEAAPEKNSQIANSRSVPRSIKKILKEHGR